MSNPIEVIDLAGDLVSVYPKSLHVICRRFIFNDEVFVGYNIHACKANSSSDDVTLQTPLLHNADEALDYIDIILNGASSVQQEPGGDSDASI